MRCGPCGTRSRSRYVRPEFLRDRPRLQEQHLILLRPRPNGNDRAWRSGAREPFSTPPVLDRRFGSMAEQRTTNAPGGASCQRRALADCWPERSDGAPKKTPYVVQKVRHFNRERVPESVVHANWAAPTRCTTRAGADMDGRARHAKDDDFGQAGTLVRDALDDAERDRMVSNIVGHVSQDVSDDVQGRMIGYWSSVDVNLGARVAAGLGCGAGQCAARGTDSTRNVRNSLVAGEAPGHEGPRPRLCPGSLLALTASYFYGARRDRLAGEDDR